ncbi:MAG TPA: hypothetical protein VKB39_08900, partial [Candidatus Baltobacteraceae bacterium]|nr:hypothetical protein [Candidatus Baltobacteraceae bacterium]
SQQNLTENIASGTTTKLKLAFQGLVSGVRFVPPSPAPTVGHSSNIAVQMAAYDADNGFIGAGTYAVPIKLSFDNSGGHMKLLSHQVTQANQNVIVQYDGQLMTGVDVVTAVGFGYSAYVNLIGNAYSSFATKERVVALTAGPNHTMLFAQCNAGCSINTVDEDGKIGTVGHVSSVVNLLLDSRRNIWISGYYLDGLDRMTLSGKITHFKYEGGTYALAEAPSGDIWFGVRSGMAKINRYGRITSYTAPLKNTVFSSSYVVIGANNRVYFDVPYDRVCSMSMSGTGAKCIGSNSHRFSAPLTPYGNGILLVAGLSNKTIASWDGTSPDHRFQTGNYLIPPTLNENGTLYGFGSKSRTYSAFSGVAVDEISDGRVRVTTYPGLFGHSFYSGTPLRLAHDDRGNIWFADGSSVVRLNTKP